MPRACVLLADGFEEIEATTIIDVLRRAEIEVVTLCVSGQGLAGLGGDSAGLSVEGSHKIRVEADRTLASAEGEKWDIVILPGGLPGATNLRDDAAVQALIKQQHDEGKPLGAICAAPIALGAAGVLQGRKATSYPGFEGELTGATCLNDRVVRDGNVVTSRGPGTAFEFSLTIVSSLVGEKVADGLREGMLIAR